MRKVLREKETCPKCGAVKFNEENVYVCDNHSCKKEIEKGNEREFETYISWFDDNRTITYQFCSFECWLEGLKKFVKMNDKEEHYINLPYFTIPKLRTLLKRLEGDGK